jgi:hypothetical protein
MTEDLQVTSGRELRREFEEGVVIRLPHSGAVVRVRSVQPDVLLDLERIPEILTPIIAALMEKGAWEPDQNPDKIEGLRQWRALVNTLVQCAMISPRVVDKPADQLGDDEIRLEHLTWIDKNHIVNVINQGVDAVAGFRDEPEGDVEPVGDAAGDKPARKRTAKSRRVVETEI